MSIRGVRISMFLVLGFVQAAVSSLLWFQSPTAWAGIAEDNKIRAKIMKVAQPLDEETVFYRWRSKASGDNLVEAGALTDSLFNYFMSMKVDSQHFAAGRGVYVSENPHTSSRFVRGDDSGSLIEVHVAKGAPFLDLSDSDTLKSLKDQGVEPKQVYKLDPKVVVKYDGENKWWAIKAQKGVTFRVFDGSNLKTRYIANIYDNLATDKSKRIYREAVQNTLYSRVSGDFDALIDSSAAQLLKDDQVTKLIKKRAEKLNGVDEVKSFVSAIFNSKILSDRIDSIKAVKSLLVDVEVKHVPIADIVSKYGDSDPTRMREVISKKFAMINSSGEYLRSLKALGEAIQNKDVQLKLMFNAPDNIFPFGKKIQMRTERRAEVQALEKTLILTDDQLLGILNKDSKGLFAVNVASYAKAVGSSQKVIGKANAILSTRKWLKIPNYNSIDELIDHRRRSLALVQDPEDYLALMKMELSSPSDAYKSALSSLAANQINVFAQLNPTMRQFTQLKNQSLSRVEDIMTASRGMLRLIKTPEDFLQLAKYEVTSPSAAYKRAMTEFVVDNMDSFIRAKPTVRDFNKLKAQDSLNYVEETMAAQKQALKLVKTPDDFITLVRFESSNPSDDYKRAMSKFVGTHAEYFVKTNPSITQVTQLIKSGSVNYHDGYFALLRAAVSLVKSPEDFIKLVEYDTSNPGKDYKKRMSQFVQDNIDRFVATDPSIKQFHKLKENESLAYMENTIQAQRSMLKQVKTPADFIKLVKIQYTQPTNAYLKAQSEFTADYLEVFLKTNPSLDDFRELKKQTLGYVEHTITAQRKMLAKVETAEDFIKLVGFELPHVSDLYFQQQYRFATENIGEFLKRNPTAAQISRLERTLRIKERSLMSNVPRVKQYLADLKASATGESKLSCLKDRLISLIDFGN